MTDNEKEMVATIKLSLLRAIVDLNEETIAMAIKAPKSEEPSEDCVSRQAVFETIDDCNSDGLKGIFCSYDDGERFKEYIKKLPPVTPTRKKRKWIFTKTIFDKYGCTAECPSCHKKWKTYDEIRWKKENKFCPNCGAEMEVEE